MKSVILIFVLFLNLFFTVSSFASERCDLRFRPDVNELAYASPGSSLITADKICHKDVLIIPYTQEAGVVRLEQGSYPLNFKNDQHQSFALTTQDNSSKIYTCPLCDPLKEVLILNHTNLCVRSALNIISCAKSGAVSFVFGTDFETQENICIPTLYYFGIEGQIVRFATTNCDNNTQELISYDLSRGTTLRYKDFRFEVLQATNQGIYYKRL